MTLGFKQTEVGTIPDDWQVVPFLSAVQIANGQVDPRIEPYRSMILIAPDHIESGSGKLIQKRTASAQAAISGKYLFDSGDIVYSKIRPYLRKATIAKFRGLCSADMYPLKARKGIESGFILPVLLSHRFSIFAEGVSARTGIPKINREDLSAFSIALPPQNEQRAIATALSDVDALLTSLDALIAKKRDIKQAAMQQLLTGKTRLPGFEGEWTVKRLDQLANIRSGGTPSTTVSRFWDGGIPWCTPTDITRLGGGKYLLDTSRQITSEGLSNSSAELIPANSVVMTSRATIGECAINLKPVTTNQGFKNFVPFEDTDVNFLYYLLQTQKQGFMQLCAGSTFLEIGKTQLAAYKVHLPSTKAEQTAIAQVLSDMDVELAALEARRDKTRLLKQGMMQELLTGKTRLV
ncbi:restriction endonuclease subunit S [Burkholderia multivorans]|uniref:restriction endonuclease subunit S n=1 Tax=Burkholderia multivorans TaxID=87883 RepID=UPI000D00DC49|nr:restriction endonuclease subunit S [Burkholderia multivorans]PRF36794.1 restriction endonuclease subunit S [Burkholderia multivorans]PRG82896.1 restriction endonuclease subunit S [Burkholderia multivorans]